MLIMWMNHGSIALGSIIKKKKNEKIHVTSRLLEGIEFVKIKNKPL